MSHCDKYAEWITDAGLGALASSREAELLAHAAECVACREACQRARQLAELIDQGVESFVAGQPSPHFATRLRARIPEEQRLREPFDWLGWKPIAASAATVAVVAVLIVSFGRWQRHPEPAALGLRADANSTDQPAPQPSATQGKSVGPGDHIAPRRQQELLLSARRGYRTAKSVLVAQPEVLVPPGQLEAIVQFARAVNAGQIDGKQLLAAEEQAEKPLIIEPLETAPLNPPQPGIAPDAPPSARR